MKKIDFTELGLYIANFLLIGWILFMCHAVCVIGNNQV